MMRLLPFLILLFLSLSCGGDKIYERSFRAMGSRVDIRLRSPSEKLFHEVVEASIKRLEEIDLLFSNYRDDSVLARVNAAAGVRPVPVPPEFLRLVLLSVRYSELTQGAFDITAGGLYGLWKESEAAGKIPSDSQVNEALKCAGFRKIRTDAEKSRVFLESRCARLDFGAIGKGYAVDEIVAIARARGISSGLVNFGGNIFAMGSPPRGRHWDVLVGKPGKGGGFLGRLELKDMGVATSGDYERYFEVGGKRYSHIIDPRTGRPAEGTTLVAAVSRTATEADVLSTAFSVLGADAARKFVRTDEFAAFLIVGKNGERKSYSGRRAPVFLKR